MPNVSRISERRAAAALPHDHANLLEPLEGRVLLDAAPFPPIADLENAGNQVLRMQTNLGTVDVELLQDAAPNTLANFLRLLEGGDLGAGVLEAGLLDDAVFHRSEAGQFLQVGPYTYTGRGLESSLRSSGMMRPGALTPGGAPVSTVVDPADPSRFAATWTVSLAEMWIDTPGADPVAATWLTFNLTDAPMDLLITLNPDAIFYQTRVIGRVLPGDSRAVVTEISELPTFNGTAGGEADPRFNFLLTDFPVTAAFSPPTPTTPPPRALAVNLDDAEVVKPLGVAAYYEHRLYYAEGFAGDTISEFVPIVNPNTETAHYQLIARFETGDRDLVVSSGQIAGNSRGGLTLSRFTDEAANLVPEGRPYALELRSTLPLSATMSHYDFGAATGESFASDPQGTWYFADALIEPNYFSFLLWQNTADVDAVVEVLFYPQNLAVPLTSFNIRTEALRRNGLNLGQLDLPQGRYGIRLSSDEGVIAVLTQYDNRNGATAAATELGVPDSAAAGGALPLARLGDNGAGAMQVITMFNPADPRVGNVAERTADVAVLFTPADTTLSPVQRTFVLAPGQILRFDASQLADELGTGPFAASFSTNNTVVMRTERNARGDLSANPFSNIAANQWHFAEGFMDPARAGINVFETLAVFNTVETAGVSNAVSVTFRFTDGFTITETFNLAAGRHLYLDLHDYEPLLAQASAGRNFYSIGVDSQFPTVTQFWHEDLTLGLETPAGGFGTIGDPFGALTFVGGGING